MKWIALAGASPNWSTEKSEQGSCQNEGEAAAVYISPRYLLRVRAALGKPAAGLRLTRRSQVASSENDFRNHDRNVSWATPDESQAETDGRSPQRHPNS
jgi:hypothetical protein